MSNRHEAEADTKRRRRINLALWSSALVVGVIIFIVLAKLVSSGSTSNNDTGSALAAADLVKKVTNVPQSVLDAVGQGSVTVLPKAITGTALTKDGKPEILYIGAEYCPYCATQRWPVVIALSQFGTFTNLGATHSASADTFPNTQTFSFHGAAYTSKYISFAGVETQTNQIQGNSYAPLDTMTAEQQKLFTTFNAPPYVDASSTGSIPFMYFAGSYINSGSMYAPSLLQGKTAMQIATALSTPSDPISQGAVGAANVLIATICKLTNNQPANVCTAVSIPPIQAKLGK